MDDLQRSTIPFYRILPVLLLVALAGCGDRETEVEDETTPAEAAEDAQGVGHLRLTGGQTVDAQYTVGCETFPNRGLQFTFTQLGTDPGPQVEVRIGDYHADGPYQGTMVVRVRQGEQTLESNGTARMEIHGQKEPGLPGRTLLSGSFEGTFQGAAGQGNASGHIERCTYRYLLE